MLVRKGSTITVTDMADGWCFGKFFEARGYVPSSYVRILYENEDLDPVKTQHTSSGLL